MRAGSCARFITVLVAPEIYLRGSQKGFDRSISYEDLIRCFEGSAVVPARAHFKSAVLRGAIEKATKGYQATEDAPVTRFWHRYWERSQTIAPDLDMKKPVGLPASSSFVYFRPGRMPRGCTLVHKMAHGFVDIQFDGMAEKLAQLRARYGSSLEPEMRITRAAKSGVIRIDVPKLRPTDNAEGQLEAIDACLRRTAELLEWFRRARKPG